MNLLNTLLIKLSSSLGLTPNELKKATIFPLALIVIFFIGDVVWRAFGLPDVQGTIEIIKGLFATYGYPLVFLSALIEALLLVGLYVPGSVALVLSATLAGQGVLNIWLVILLITLGFLIAVIINYALGRYGWYRVLVRFGLKDALERMKLRAEKGGMKLIHLTYLNPNLASLSATSFGILHINFGKFLFHSIIAFIYWNILWGFSFYFLGDWVEEYLDYTNLVIAIVAFIFIRIVYVVVRKRFKNNKIIDPTI